MEHDVSKRELMEIIAHFITSSSNEPFNEIWDNHFKNVTYCGEPIGYIVYNDMLSILTHMYNFIEHK